MRTGKRVKTQSEFIKEEKYHTLGGIHNSNLCCKANRERVEYKESTQWKLMWNCRGWWFSIVLYMCNRQYMNNNNEKNLSNYNEGKTQFELKWMSSLSYFGHFGWG